MIKIKYSYISNTSGRRLKIRQGWKNSIFITSRSFNNEGELNAWLARQGTNYPNRTVVYRIVK